MVSGQYREYFSKALEQSFKVLYLPLDGLPVRKGQLQILQALGRGCVGNAKLPPGNAQLFHGLLQLPVAAQGVRQKPQGLGDPALGGMQVVHGLFQRPQSGPHLDRQDIPVLVRCLQSLQGPLHLPDALGQPVHGLLQVLRHGNGLVQGPGYPGA